ncbi:MAG: nucleotidyltransferase, partial [Chloroflexota bacterium]|nr:nucleotidyltransferase [Chloroflexota bacterium]
MEKKLLTALHQAAQFLKREKIPFVVIGGLANSVIGEPRSTRDVDLKVYLEGRTGQEFAALVVKELAPAELLPAGSPLIVSVITSPNVIIDFLIAIPGYEDEVLVRAPIVRIGNLQVPVCTPEDFIIYKVVA